MRDGLERREDVAATVAGEEEDFVVVVEDSVGVDIANAEQRCVGAVRPAGAGAAVTIARGVVEVAVREPEGQQLWTCQGGLDQGAEKADWASICELRVR